MGYNTNYIISIKEGQMTGKEFEVLKNILEKNSNYLFSLNHSQQKLYCEGKWYEHEKDMKKVSKLFPNVTFQIYGEGEESGDIWKDYVNNGKLSRTRAVISFEAVPADEEELLKMLYEVMELGMTTRESQLKGDEQRAGNEILKEWYKNYKINRKSN